MPIRLLKTLFAALLCYSVFAAQATGISIDTRVENISYDLGFMRLSLENIGSSMRLSPTTEGRLLIEDVRARRLLITMVPDAPPAGSDSGLPERIQLPLAIQVQTASVDEVIIIDGESRRTLKDVVFHLQADGQRLQLQLMHASTPWGLLQGDLAMQNARPFTLNGKLNLKQTGAGHPYDLQLDLAGDLQRLRFSSAALLRQIDNQQAGKQTALLHAESDIAAGAVLGRIAVDGQLGLDGALPLELHARFSEFGPYLSTNHDKRLNADVRLQGTLAPQTELRLHFETVDSRWLNAPLALQASARLRGQVFEDITLDGKLQNNRLQASGSLGSPSSTLAWQAAFGDIAAFNPTLQGRFNAEGKISGAFGRLAADMQWLGEQLGVSEGLAIERLTGQSSLARSEGAPLSLSMRAENLRLNHSPAMNADLQLTGTRAQHRIELNSQTAASQQPLLQALVSGRINDSGTWIAQLEKLSHQGARPVELLGQARLQYDQAQGFALENLVLAIAGGQLQVDQLRVGNDRLVSKGRFDRIGLAALPEILLKLPANMSGNPAFSGSWDIAADETANGRADIRLVSGDIGIRSGVGSIRQLGLGALDARLELSQNRVRIDASSNGKALGALRFDLATQLEPTASGFVLNRQAPLEISADARLQSLIWLPLPESMAGAEMDGRLDMQLSGKGTIARPDLQGTLQGRQLRLTVPSEGVDLQNGTLDAAFRGDQLEIRQARFAGGDGFITAAGKLSLQNGEPQLALQWHAENFTAVSRTDRMMIIAGDLDTRLSGQQMAVSGAVEITRGLIELAAEDKPALGDDVVIIGAAEETSAHPLLLQVSDLSIGIGNQPGSLFVLRGRGLDSTMKGTIKLNGRTDRNLRAEGAINAAGTYMAYGQVLNIERGQLVFNGQIDNPGLDILALRQNMAVRAGVEIRGTALNPAIKLVSVPEVSDSDKLAWLVLGHGMDRVGQDQFAMLSLAAGALLSQGQSVPLQTRFARAAGLDSFNVGGSDAESASVSLGKRLAPNLYLSYEKEVTGLLNVARLTYDLTSNWSVRTQAGSESAVDVLYTFSFK